MALNNVDNGFEQPITGADNAPFIAGDLVPSRNIFGISNGGVNTVNIAILVTDGHNLFVKKPVLLNLWLSDSVTGEGLTATIASGGVTFLLGDLFDITFAAKLFLVQTDGINGSVIVQIVDIGDTPFVIAIRNPFTGLTSVSRPLVATDYNP